MLTIGHSIKLLVRSMKEGGVMRNILTTSAISLLCVTGQSAALTDKPTSEATIEYSSTIDVNAFRLVRDEAPQYTAGMTQTFRPFTNGEIRLGLRARGGDDSADINLGIHNVEWNQISWSFKTSYFTQLLDDGDAWKATITAEGDFYDDDASPHSVGWEIESEWLTASELDSMTAGASYAYEFGCDPNQHGCSKVALFLGAIAELGDFGDPAFRTQLTYDHDLGSNDRFGVRLRYRRDEGDRGSNGAVEEQLIIQLAVRNFQ